MRNGELESMKKVKFKMTGNASEIEKSSESSCLCASVLKKDAGVVEGDFNTEAQRLRGTEFKMTEMGLIPEDWEVKRLGDVSSNFNYGVGAEAVPYIEGPRYIRITDIDENSHKFTPDQTVAAAFSDPNSIVNDGDILVARTGASVGKSYLYDKSDGDLIFAGFLMRFHPIEVISAYVYRQTLTGRYWQWIASESARSGQPGINIQQLKSFQIPVPPLAEQKKIAEVLSDVDELLAAMTTLIEKKRAIKQGAMQELLTGKKRLPGFGGKCRQESLETEDFNAEAQRRRGTEFKMTEMGLIPEDWEVKRLGDVSSNFNYGVGAEAVPYIEGPRYIRITDIDENSHKFTPDQTVAAAFSDPNSIVNDGDILVARTGASVGKSYLYDKSDGDLIFAGFLMRFHPIEVISAYVYRQTLTGRYWQWIASESARSGQPGINIQQLKSFQIPVPPLAEQKKIAEVLSDVDELLAAMTTLIEKKRAIKQGAMQELLTGKKRLPGFGGKSLRSLRPLRDKKSPTENAEIAEFKQTELGEIPVDWEVKRLGDCGFCFNGITGKSGNDFGHGKSRYITFLNVLTNIVIDSSILELVNICSNEKQNEVRQGDIFFNTSSETPEEVGLCAVLEEDVKSVYLNSFCFGFRITDNDVSGKFLAYWFRSAAGRTLMTTLAQGSTRYNLSKESFRGAYVCIPPSLAEQKAIAEVLSDMDAEIEALEAKRAKYESIKQGMMQELLTGKIRLEV